MKVVVTGATGFVGRELVEELLRQKDEVTVIVREKRRIPEKWVGCVQVIEASMEQFAVLERADFPWKEADMFLHLAWNGTADSRRADVPTQLQNIQASCDAISLAKKLNCKRFVNAGSIMEYEAIHYLLSESAVPGMGYIYSTAKLAADFMVKTMAANLHMDYINVVISNIYGPGESSPRFINTTIRKMLKNEALELTHGQQLYDFIYITDAVKEIALAGKKGTNNQIYYIGNDTPRPLKDFIIQMKEVLESRSELQFGKLSFRGPLLSYKEFDTESMRKLGYHPTVTFEQGIMALKNWIVEEEDEYEF